MWIKLFFSFLFFLTFASFQEGFSKSKEKFSFQKEIISQKNKNIKVILAYNKENLSLYEDWKIKITFFFPATYNLKKQYLALSDYIPLELIADPIEKIRFHKSKKIWEKSFFYSFQSLSVGNYKIKEKNFILENLESEEEIFLNTPEINLTFQSKLPQDIKLTPAQGILLKENYTPFYIFAIFLGLCILIYFLRKKNNVKEKKITAIEWALRELRVLKGKPLLTTEEVKSYHLEISRILRTFLEKQLEVKLQSQTSEAFFKKIQRNKNFKEKHKHLLKDYLKLNDLAKFAKYRPSEKDNIEIFNLVKKIILTLSNK